MLPDPSAPEPIHVLCVLSTGTGLDEIGKVAAAAGGLVLDEYSQPEPDDRMPAAFRASLSTPSFTDADTAAVQAHDAVAYLQSPAIIPGLGELVSRRTLIAAGELLRNGATAVKNESSGITHGRDRWLELADWAATAEDPTEAAIPLYQAWVQQPITSGTIAFSCGMHLLGQPDIELDFTTRPDLDTPDKWRELIDALALYILTEERGRHIEDGEGFRLAEDDPRWILNRTDCERYETDDIAHNPWGYWRLTPA